MISIKALGMYSSDFSGGETRNGDTQIVTDGKYYDVIDGGCDRYATRLITYLKTNNIRDPYLHASHPHYDHIDGINKILSDPWFTPRGLYCQDPDSITAHNSSIRSDINALRNIIAKAKKKDIPVIFLDNEQKVEHGEIKITVYRQYPKYSGNSDAYLNDGSLCYWFAEQRYLTTGDASMWCAYKYNLDPLIVKGGHHGNDMSADGYLKPSQMCIWLYKHGCRFYWDNDFSTKLTDFLMTGREDAINAGMTFIDIHGDIDMVFACGKVTITHAGKSYTDSVPYSGEYKECWIKNATGWWYRYKDGSWPANCFADLRWSQGIDTFCFDSRGYMVTGWRKIDGTWYFFDRKNGDMKTGWIFDNGVWYYLGSDGKMVTGWITYKNKRCYLDPASGHCYVDRTATIDGITYRFDRNGYAEEVSAKSCLNGIDIASYQSGINPARLSTTDFVIVKFTQGTSYLNPYADRQYSTSKSAGKLLGAYHYAEGKDAKAEAQHFVSSLGSRVGECILALDWEGNQNSRFGSGQDVTWCKTFLDEVYRLTGVRALIYMSKSVTRKYNWAAVTQNYPLWCAQYKNNSTTDYQSAPWTDSNSFGAWSKDTIRQYSSHGRIAGYDANIDLDLAYVSADQWRTMAAGKRQEPQQDQRAAIVSEAISHIGVKEGTVLHHKIIDRYNSRKPLPRGYAVKYTDAWCATFISYLAIVMGYTDIIPVECGCPQMITLAKQMGIWVENDAYVPKPGDIVLYDWQDSGSGDNTGTADHIGIVEKVVEKTETVIEGNYKDAVGRRELAVNGRYIRGYIVPKYQ